MIASSQTLNDYVSVTRGQLLQGDCTFERVSTDTRSLVQGDLFIALRGEHYDAHNYLGIAVDKGACALVTEVFEPELSVPQLVVEDTVLAFGQMAAARRQKFSGTVIGITGSSGKTTVKGMLKSILEKNGTTHATRGNFNNHIGVPITLMELDLNACYAIVEEGTNHPGEIAYLTNIVRPDIALVNNVMPAHIENFVDLAAIAAEKQAIYHTLSKGDIAVVNLDDEFAQSFLQTCATASLVTYARSTTSQTSAIHGQPDIYSELIAENTLGKPILRLFSGGDVRDITLAVVGTHNIDNALAAAACAYAAGVDIDTVKSGLESYYGDPGRMQSKVGCHNSIVVDDSYNANPGSVKAAIDFLASHRGWKLLVLGNMAELGEYSEEFHRQVGEYAEQAEIDALYTVGDLAHTSALAFGENAKTFADKEQLIEVIKSSLQNNSMILVKGSRSAGMEDIVNAIVVNRETSHTKYHNNKEAY